MSIHNKFNAKKCLSKITTTPKTILIVGCGNQCEDIKAFNELFSSQNKQKPFIVGLDIVDDTGAGCAVDNVVYLKSDITKSPLIMQCFDLVYSFATFEHIFDIGTAWQNMLNVLKIGGSLYCVSSPLWCSPYGHHKADIFKEHPWIHLRYPDVDSLLEFCEKNKIASTDNIDLIHHIRYMLSIEFFNKHKPSFYKETAESLIGGHIVDNSFKTINVSNFVDTYNLNSFGYTDTDLFSTTHNLHIIKK